MQNELVKIECCRAKDSCPRALGDPGELVKYVTEALKNTNYSLRRQKVLQDSLKHSKVFKISLAGCPNCCSQPQIKDFGAYKAIYPEVFEEKCTLCENCIRQCREGALFLDGSNKVLVDLEKCIGCGDCLKFCAQEAISTGQEFWRLIVGGKLGRHPQLAVKIADVACKEDIRPYLEKYLEIQLDSKDPHLRLGDLINKESIKE
ncbi:MAG: hypothetical protein APF76_06620 [Desulfitibacter sp. BRH_c19]|nr:MAG: hypothetical protein APF76_06620 [Desulfitibacter sp. BRH_c19]